MKTTAKRYSVVYDDVYINRIDVERADECRLCPFVHLKRRWRRRCTVRPRVGTTCFTCALGVLFICAHRYIKLAPTLLAARNRPNCPSFNYRPRYNSAAPINYAYIHIGPVYIVYKRQTDGRRAANRHSRGHTHTQAASRQVRRAKTDTDRPVYGPPPLQPSNYARWI